jgi:hypothetical protein
MYGGRIESERSGLALDRVRQRAPALTADVRPSDSRSAETKRTAPENLETLANPTEQRAANSPRRYIADFVTPKISDPTVLQSAQLVSILERLVSSVLPNLEDGEELRSLACTLIADEIARHRDLQTRLHSGITA